MGMKRNVLSVICLIFLMAGLVSCAEKEEKVKIGVSFGVGEAPRWEKEKSYMEERAKEKGVDMEVRLNKTDKPKTQEEDCKEMIDGGIDVLILTPRDVNNVKSIISYAKEKDVMVVSYARAVADAKVNLYVGYDCFKIGQTLGEYLVEKVDKGDYIVLKGDENDFNTKPLYEGGMEFITPLAQDGDINILMDEYVVGWSADDAKQKVLAAIQANGNKVDAIFAPNDKIAGACREALNELNITTPVAITGMDADIEALKRIIDGQQSMTIYMDLKELSSTAVDQAINMALGEKVESNSTFYNNSDAKSNAYLINGKEVLKENMDRVLIEPGYFTKEEVYGQ